MKEKTKKMLPMRKQAKADLAFWTAMSVGGAYTIADEVFKLKSSAAECVILLIIISLILLTMARKVWFSLAYEAEKDDELSMENKLKADSMITAFTVTVLLIVYLFTKFGTKFSITLTSADISGILVEIFFIFRVLQNGFFLMLDRSGGETEEQT